MTINTDYTGSTYQLRDVIRATNPNFNVTPIDSSIIYTNPSNVFGDGTSGNTQSAAADAMWGVQAAYDKLHRVYRGQGVEDRLETRLWPVPHEFNADMQAAAFDWLDRQLPFPLADRQRDAVT